MRGPAEREVNCGGLYSALFISSIPLIDTSLEKADLPQASILKAHQLEPAVGCPIAKSFDVRPLIPRPIEKFEPLLSVFAENDMDVGPLEAVGVREML